ncbi:MAG: type II secretion system protein M [Sphingomonadales bacterium]|nr:type II secretion system protein M [Sphingomonadales bacterium]
MSALREQWHALSAREQVLIRIMLALALLVFLLLAVMRPLMAYVAEGPVRLAAAERLHTRALAAAHGTGGAARNAQSSLPLDDRVRQSAEEAGFEIAQSAPAPDGALSVTLASARGPALFAWVGALEGRGVVVRSARIDPRSDATLAVSLELEAAR